MQLTRLNGVLTNQAAHVAEGTALRTAIMQILLHFCLLAASVYAGPIPTHIRSASTTSHHRHDSDPASVAPVAAFTTAPNTDDYSSEERGSADAQTVVNTAFGGIWDRSDALGPSDYHLIRGVAAGPSWSHIEPSNGNFDFKPLDDALTKAAQLKGAIYVQIAVGPDSPRWIYSNGVPKVTPKPGKPKFTEYPFYLDSTYQRFYHRMINNTAQYLRSHKHSSLVAFVQMDYGCTGDGVACGHGNGTKSMCPALSNPY